MKNCKIVVENVGTKNYKIVVENVEYSDEPIELFTILKPKADLDDITYVYGVLLSRFDSTDWRVTVYHVTDSSPETYFLDITDSL